MSDPPFDFARYFARVQRTSVWHDMYVGLAEYAGVTSHEYVLDVGAGPGSLVDHLRRGRVRAIGVDADMAVGRRFKRAYPQHPLTLSLVERLPFAGGTFDRVLAGNLLFFLPDPVAALGEMARTARSGATIAIWNPSEQMSQAAAQAYAARHPALDEFSRKHLVNWAGVAERNRRWSTADLQALFAAAALAEFESRPILGGLARYARGRKR